MSAMTECLRPGCDHPTVYGSPACVDHWKAWSDEATARALHAWGMDRDADVVAAESTKAQDTYETAEDWGRYYR